MIEERYLKIYFGRLSGYYLDMYREYHAGNRYPFNVSTWLGTILWFFYRKLYIELALVLFCFFTSDIIIALILYFVGVTEDLIQATTTLYQIFFGILIGFLGNNLYLRKTDKIIHRILARTTDENERIRLLKKKGDTSWSPFILIALIFVLLYLSK
ncbi:MAG: DUF2628 domain-containing protein [Cyclobacteriaceae bacterium]|nr:DUF2628 domain-containing protein [Cyclobacteriaceae bacterium]